MPPKYQALLKRVNEIHDLTKTLAVLNWDKEVNMPQAGASVRIQQITTLNGLIHDLSIADEMGELIEAAAVEINGAAYESDECSLIRYLRRSFADARKLSPDYVARSSKISGEARMVWAKARAEDDFPSFQPWLEQIVALCQEKAELYGYDDEKYDALLDKYELEMKTAEVRAIFNDLKAELVPLRELIEAKGTAVADSIVHQHFDIDKQKSFARYAASAVGYDFTRGHLGTVVHPFATSFSRDDARITTRWRADFLNTALFGTLHEAGHALYEQGTHPNLTRTPLARGTSLGIHESQSRLIENMVGRSLGFWKAHFPVLQAFFPQQLGRQTIDDFYRAINKVKPSLIRVEADELTYNFHIILRFELEQAMLNGELATRDLPEAWNQKMVDLLGIVPTTNREGCLQDVHWTRPDFGYFPTYALGNLYAAQFLETAVAHIPLIEEEMAEGKTQALLTWLGDNIHQHGRKFTPREIVNRVTNRPLSHHAFMRYVTRKFSDIYKLR